MERVVFLERGSVAADFRRPGFPHTWRAFDATRADEVVPRLEGATIAIVNKARLDAEALAALPDLRLVAVAATGVDNVDVGAASARGVSVCNVRGYAVASVPEHALMLMLALRRNLLAYRRDVAEGAWGRTDNFCLLTHPLGDLAGATLGVVGHGAIGQAMARLGAALGMRVRIAERRGASPRAGRVPFEQVLAESDVLSLHCALTPETRRLIDAEALAAMKPGALLINTARGGLVDEAALAQALLSGRLGGAGLDVLSVEPPREPNPLLALELPNLIVTPHVGWASRQAMQALADQVIDNLEAFVAGTPRHLVS